MEKKIMYCIYRITNLINGKTYIGQHKYEELNDNYMGSGTHLKAAQAKYGIENFKKEILIYNVSKKEHINLLEKTFIASEREKVGQENCYNIAEGGEGGFFYKGHLVSEETRKKMSEALKGKNKGKKLSEEHKKKIADAMKRSHNCYHRHHSDETKKKMSEAHKGMSSSFKGKKMSEEQKKKLSEAMKGNTNALGHKYEHKCTEEHKRKIGESNKGRRLSEETKKKISEANKGKHSKLFSEEHKKKISEAHKGKHWKLVDGKRIWT